MLENGSCRPEMAAAIPAAHRKMCITGIRAIRVCDRQVISSGGTALPSRTSQDIMVGDASDGIDNTTWRRSHCSYCMTSQLHRKEILGLQAFSIADPLKEDQIKRCVGTAGPIEARSASSRAGRVRRQLSGDMRNVNENGTGSYCSITGFSQRGTPGRWRRGARWSRGRDYLDISKLLGVRKHSFRDAAIDRQTPAQVFLPRRPFRALRLGVDRVRPRAVRMRSKRPRESHSLTGVGFTTPEPDGCDLLTPQVEEAFSR